MKYDVVIVHRVCPALSKTAVGFKNKYDMVLACAQSMIAALVGVNYRMVLILDGCPEYASIFKKLIPDDRLKIIETESIGNQKTWAKQVEILSSVQDAKYVYFSEDDYLYQGNAFKTMLSFMKMSGVDYITPLDHPDRYRTNIREMECVRIRPCGSCHWREVGTTCLTFMMRTRDIPSARIFFDSYSNGNLDGVLWLGLTKERLFDFGLLVDSLRFLFHRIPFGRILQLAVWKQFGLRLLFSHRFHLWSPIPTLAVHLSSASLPVGAGKFFADDKLSKEIEKITRSYLTT